MSRIYDNWERLVGEVLKREQFREMALAPPSRESSFSSSFASSSRHEELGVGNSATGATPGGIAARAALLFAKQIAYFWRRKQQDHSFDFPDPFGADVYLEHPETLSLHELNVATDDFSNINIIGSGGFGKVYKGRLADGTLVAVKRLKRTPTPDEDLQFQTEVDAISMAVHRNLLRLRGFCKTSTDMFLVYPYMANGSIASWLRERPESQPPLDWPIRKRIALGSASGLAYLHENCKRKIIHRDVKAANILLDEDFEAVVGDFGSAKLMDHGDAHVKTDVIGTISHIAPEYLSTGKVSEKTDVFSYGIMLLELITGHRAITRLDNVKYNLLLTWVKELVKEKKLDMLVDTDLKDNYIDEEVEQLIQVALLCTQCSPNKRPNMPDVVRMLQGDDLAERWEECHIEIFHQEFNNTQYKDIVQIFPDSSCMCNMDTDDFELSVQTFSADFSDNNVTDDELSGPR